MRLGKQVVINGIHNCHTVLTTVVTNYVFFYATAGLFSSPSDVSCLTS